MNPPPFQGTTSDENRSGRASCLSAVARERRRILASRQSVYLRGNRFRMNSGQNMDSFGSIHDPPRIQEKICSLSSFGHALHGSINR